MRKLSLALFGLLVVAAFIAGSYVLFTPKIGHATRAQIDAPLPASLLTQDPPDPAAEGRYKKLAALVRPLDEHDLTLATGSLRKPADPAVLTRLIEKGKSMIDGVDALLKEGGIRYPGREITTRFTDSLKLKDFEQLLSVAMKDAAARGDHAGCARLAALSLRYARTLIEGGGVIVDSLVAIASDGVGARAVYEAEMAGGFDAAGRTTVLKELPVEHGALPALGDAVRRDFQAMFLPVLTDPKHYLTPAYIEGVREDETPHGDVAGTFDPVATAKLAGAIYDAGIAEATRPATGQAGLAGQLAEAAGRGLPERPQDSGGMGGLWYRLRMNAGRNTLGRQFASEAVVFDGLAKAAQHRAANLNLVRAVLLLRSGQGADLPDPYGAGKLKVDPKRRIVWSVGENGKDDGGDIGASPRIKGLDLGYRY